MHELAMARAILEAAQAEARRRGIANVRGVRCRVGVLRQIDSDMLRSAFEVLQADADRPGMELVVEAAPMTATCPACRDQFDISGADWSCPHCGAAGTDLCGGDQMEITGLIVDDPPSAASTSLIQHTGAQP